MILLLAAMVATAQRVDYKCTPEDVDLFGLTCSEDAPCPVLLELASFEQVGGRMFLTGNFHTGTSTLYGLLLVSEDGGKTWAEPAGRFKQSALEQIQFSGFGNGWVAGVRLEPLPRDPFFLITTDGGKTWRNRPMFEDTHAGSIGQFWFESNSAGELYLDSNRRYEVYQSMTGGESWELKEVTKQQPKLAKAKTGSDTWRLRADAPSKSYKLEQRTTQRWEAIATFPLLAGECK